MSLGGSYGESDNNNAYQQQTNSSTNTNSTQQPLNSPQVTSALDSAQTMYQNGNPTAQAGLSGINTAAGNSADLYNAGNSALTTELNGSLTSANNPYFTNMFQGVANAVTPAVASSFEGNGRYGSGAFANADASALSQEAGNLAYGNYTNALGLQSTAAQSLPSYTAGSLAPGAAQLNAAYLPLQQYISALSAVSPGQTGTSQATTVGNQTGTSQGNTSGWNVNANV